MLEKKKKRKLMISTLIVIIILLLGFEILKFLGKGAFGRVYLAKRTDTTDLYALKFLKMYEGQN